MPKLIAAASAAPRVAWLGFTTTYNTEGTSKIRGSRTRHRMLWVGKVHEFCGNPHFRFSETRSSIRVILRRRFGKPPLCQVWGMYLRRSGEPSPLDAVVSSSSTKRSSVDTYNDTEIFRVKFEGFLTNAQETIEFRHQCDCDR